MGRNSFVAYGSYRDAAKRLPFETRAKFYEAIFDYALDGDYESGQDPIVDGYMDLIIPQIDAAAERHQESVKNGKKGGRPPKKTIEQKEKTNGFENEKPMVSDKKRGGFENKNLNVDVDVYVDDDVDVYNSFLHGAENNSEPKEEPVIELTLNDKSEYPITQTKVDEWQELYPAVDVMQQLRNMKGWLDSNPTRRKTKTGINRFITGWLSKEQNRGGSVSTRGKPNKLSADDRKSYQDSIKKDDEWLDNVDTSEFDNIMSTLHGTSRTKDEVLKYG